MFHFCGLQAWLLQPPKTAQSKRKTQAKGGGGGGGGGWRRIQADSPFSNGGGWWRGIWPFRHANIPYVAHGHSMLWAPSLSGKNRHSQNSELSSLLSHASSMSTLLFVRRMPLHVSSFLSVLIQPSCLFFSLISLSFALLSAFFSPYCAFHGFVILHVTIFSISF